MVAQELNRGGVPIDPKGRGVFSGSRKEVDLGSMLNVGERFRNCCEVRLPGWIRECLWNAWWNGEATKTACVQRTERIPRVTKRSGRSVEDRSL